MGNEVVPSKGLFKPLSAATPGSYNEVEMPKIRLGPRLNGQTDSSLQLGKPATMLTSLPCSLN